MHVYMYSILPIALNMLPAGISHMISTYMCTYASAYFQQTDSYSTRSSIHYSFVQKHLAEVEQGTIVGIRGHI